MNQSLEHTTGRAVVDIFQAYQQANAYLNEGLTRTWPITTPYEKRCDWMPRFQAACGNPEKGIPAIHIAGTSGKGTTGIMIAEILRSAGIRTGLHLSPYLQISTEKIWVDGLFIHGLEFYNLVETLRPVIEHFRPQDLPLHGMANVVAALEAFRRENVELMVFETGVGGRYDLTNFLNTTLSVITRIGYDHQQTLGRTITSIAYHKAGIIKTKTPVLALAGPGLGQIRAEARLKSAALTLVKPALTCRNVRLSRAGAVFDYHGQHWEFNDVCVSARGPFQVENAALAITTAEILAELGWAINESHVRQGLLKGFLPGRIEVIQRQPTVLLDGAHNADKMANLSQYLGLGQKTKVVVLCGVLAKKLNRAMINQIRQFADVLVTTEPGIYAKVPLPARTLAQIIARNNDRVRHVVSEPDPLKALDLALDLCRPADVLVVTGSLYLVGNVRHHWYPEPDVLIQRTSYPGPGSDLEM